jgi:hypothetical protein
MNMLVAARDVSFAHFALEEREKSFFRKHKTVRHNGLGRASEVCDKGPENWAL